MQYKIRSFFIFYFLFFIFSADAQQNFLPLNREIYNRYETELNNLDNSFHTGMKPYRIAEFKQHLNSDSINNTFYFDVQKNKSLIGRKVRKENLIIFNKEYFQLTIDPLFNLEFGKELTADSNSMKVINMRGVILTGSIGEHFSFSSSFYENQGTFVNYVDNYILKNHIVPGQGYTRQFESSGSLKKIYQGNAYDYGMVSGYISYSPSKYFNFQFGNDKNFIGDGYRSLLLSDNSFNYPFFKITTDVWRIKYVNIYTQLTDIKSPNSLLSGYQKKYGSFHYLSVNITKRVNIGLFEAVIWSGDSMGNRGWDLNYLNPIIFYRPVDFSLGSPGNMMLGATMKVKINNTNLVYGQLVLDEFKLEHIRKGDGWHANKQGFQLGMKNFNLFTVKNLMFQTEYNHVRPYTYSETDQNINYAHYNQPLAHPLGANFWESVSFLNYRYKSFYAEAKFSYAIYGEDTLDAKGNNLNFGKNVYLSYTDRPKDVNGVMREVGFYIGEGLKNILIYKDIRVGYVVNPKTNLNVELGISSRTQTNERDGTKNTNFIYFGIRTSLTNHYYDF